MTKSAGCRLFIQLLFITLFSISKSAFAGTDPPVILTLNGNLKQLAKDSFRTVQDDKFFDTSYNSKLIKPYTVHNRVSLRINESSPYYTQTSFTAVVKVRIITTNYLLAIDTILQTLSVSYQPTTASIWHATNDSYIFSDCYRVEVQIVDTSAGAGWNVWNLLYVENELQSFPAFNFSCTANAIQTISDSALATNGNEDQLPVSWANVANADQYDLEWCYIDSSALSMGRYGDSSSPTASLIFANNASRVTITGTSYDIPLFYDGSGSLFFRVRPVQLQGTAGISAAEWSSDFVSTGGLGRFDFKGHQRSLNWQATTTFAEEGKRKTVVQYYDGSLRGRQTVTKDNSTLTTIVAETFYDYQGRPAIQVMPAPTINTIIQYSQNFNIGINGNAYDKSNFDTLLSPGSYCTTGADAMNTDSGAARYYSPNNPEMNNGISYNNFIPNAHGHPFTETQYTQDNTGRISKQSGVDSIYRISGGHETMYFYGTPDQSQLDGLFGTEVGDHHHYFKTMVRDANGQYSVSYADMHGRTIATALSGTPDSVNLDPLSNNIASSITETIADSTTNVIVDLTMESKKGLLVSTAGTNTFTYTLSPQTLQLKGCDSSTVCYDCLYNLEITITDNCNNASFGGIPYDTLLTNFSLASIDTACNNTSYGFSFSFSKYLGEGSYDITKKLTVSHYGSEYLRDSFFLKKNTCRNLSTTISQQATILAGLNTQCTPTCVACTDSLGTYSVFYTRFMQKAGIANSDTAANAGLALLAYQDAQADCKALCDSTSAYDDIMADMLLDVTPTGQYANIDTVDKYSIFHSYISNVDGAHDTIPNYQKVSLYLNDDGKPDSVYDEISGMVVIPQQLTPTAFAYKFKTSWANALLPFHPEYCKLLQYMKITASAQWDRRFESTDSYDSALSKGYLNPTDSSGPPYNTYNATGASDYDPLRSFTGYNYRAHLNSLLLNYTDNTAETYNSANRLVQSMSMWAFATATVKCTGQPTSCFTNYENNDSAFNSNMCPGDLDMAWRNFRQFYLDVKTYLINQILIDSCTSPSVATLIAAGHQPHFSDAIELTGAAGLTMSTDTNTAKANAQDSLNSYYNSNCRAYVTYWLQQLQNCNYTSADTAVIIPELVQVCMQGSDPDHPYGASTVAPASTNQYRSFEDVITAYNQTHHIGNTYCNAYSILSPKPYDQQVVYTSKPIYYKPDSCECSHINELYTAYQAVSGTYSSFSNYMLRVYSTSISDSSLTLLMNLCNTSTATCNFQQNPISLPPALQCSTGDVCVNCEKINTLNTEFHNLYPTIVLIANPSATDSLQINDNNLYTNFMNYNLGFVQTVADYINFTNSCNNLTTTQTVTYDALQQILKNYQMSGGALQPDAAGCDTSHWKINYSGEQLVPNPGSSSTYDAPVPLNQIFVGGIADHPQTNWPTTGDVIHVSYDYKDSINFGTNDYVYEARIRTLGNLVAAPWLGVQAISFAGGHQARIYYYQNSLVYGIDNVYTTITPSFTLDFSSWHIMSMKFLGDSLYYYYDSTLLATSYTGFPTANVVYFYNGIASSIPEMDYVKYVDTSGNVLFSDQFYGCNQTEVNVPRYSALTCTARFTAYYNQVKGSAYSFGQIDSIYNSFGIPLTVCGADPGDTCKSFGFIQTYGGNGDDEARDLVQTPDGGFLTTGITNSYGSGSYDGFITKTDNNGNVIWSKAFGGAGFDEFIRIKKTFDGGFIALGNTQSYSQTQGEPFLVKGDANGNVQWSRELGAGTTYGENAIDVIQLADSGYAVASTYDYIAGLADWEVFRLDTAGNTLWAEHMGSYSSDDAGGIVEDNDTLVFSGLFYSTALGGSNPPTYYDGIIMKLNLTNGNLIWAKSYDIDSRANWFGDLFKTATGYLINTVASDNFDGGNVVHIIPEFDKNGNVTRMRKFTPPNNSTSIGYQAVYPTADGGYISAQTDGSDSSNNYLYKNNNSGSISWANKIKIPGNQYFYRIIQNADGTYAGAGSDNGHILFVKTDTLGKTGCADSSFMVSDTTPVYTEYDESFPTYTFTLNNNLIAIGTTPAFSTQTQTTLCFNNPCSKQNDTLTLCGRAALVSPPIVLSAITNCYDSSYFAISKGTEIYNGYVDSLQNIFDSTYRSKCLNAYKYESFKVTHTQSEYQYTLYYYDQGGNLVKTVPPAGVNANFTTSFVDSVESAKTLGQTKVPSHTLYTQYRYNTLNQVIAQNTPDASLSSFWYDRLGRLAISQNAKQKAASTTETNRPYSYTLYDQLGRIKEVGQIANAGSVTMSDSISRSDTLLNAWITTSAANKAMITQTNYDVAYAGFSGYSTIPVVQRNMRNRVSYTSYTLASNPANYNQASFFTYDIEGNVDTLIQDYGSITLVANQNIMNKTGNRLKQIVYQYDLISGKVNEIAYQRHYPDQFFHVYTYDAENRLTNVQTSSDSSYWETDARYSYYKHGPLARMVVGDLQLQGVDYAYTLQGWLKGVNSISLKPMYDMGGDGDTISTNINKYVGSDIYGYNLNYFSGDYSPINSSYNPFPGTSAYLNTNYRPLYNGNISSMAVNIGFLYLGGGYNPEDTVSTYKKPMLYNYNYDQLNRITGMKAYYGLNQYTNSWSGLTFTPDYKEKGQYDANGNITKYTRYDFGNSPTSPKPMDSLTYHYNSSTNQLNYIYDSATTSTTYDLKKQPVNNYKYDAIGNLVKDSIEKISNITWNVYGKITEIDHSATTSYNLVKNMTYGYDASGNRISKRTTLATSKTVSYIWYVRDASGNVMATYTASGDSTKNLNTYTVWLDEMYIYGSSRLGMLAPPVAANGDSISYYYYSSPWGGQNDSFQRGMKTYEFTNHLGNVLETITDYKLPVPQSGHDSLVDHYTANIVTGQDYYPGGMLMQGRQVQNNYQNYRYGFNGKENDDEAKGQSNQVAFENRVYDPRVGRWLSIDPLQKKYPAESPYSFVSNNPVFYADKDGRDKITTVTTIGKDGTKTILTIRDKTQFDYVMDANLNGGYNYLKRDIYENDIIDLGARVGESPLKRREITYGTQAYASNAAEYFFIQPFEGLKNLTQKISGDQSNQELEGYVIYGSSTNGGPDDQNKLPKAGIGSQNLDLGTLLSTLDIFEAGGSPADFLQEGSKLKKLVEAAENATKAISKLDEAKEQMEKIKESTGNSESSNKAETQKMVKPPLSKDSAICPKCSNRQDSSHIDDNNGKGFFDKLKAAGQTNNTQKNQ
jgi:RHS repeat-associated protein